MHLEAIEQFVEFCKYMSFTKAAKQMHIAQPTLSYQIATLEKELGFLLIDRRKPLQLTPAGKTFFAGITPLQSEYHKLVNTCRDLADTGDDDTKLVVKTPVIAWGRSYTLLKSFLGELRAASVHHNWSVEFTQNYPRHFLDEMLEGNYDCTLTYFFRGNPRMLAEYYPDASNPRLSAIYYHPIAQLSLCAAVSAESPLAERPKLLLKDLEKCTVLYNYPLNAAELHYGIASFLEYFGIRTTFKPVIMSFSEIQSLGEYEVLLVESGYQLPNSLVCKQFVEDTTLPVYVALRKAGGDAASARSNTLVHLEELLKKGTQ